MNLRTMIERILEPMRIKIRAIVSRALVEIVSDKSDIQMMQISVLRDEVKDDIERVQNYGFTSVPASGAEAVVLFVNGNKENGIVVACEQSKFRLKGLKENEVAVYHKDGHYIKLTEDGVEIENNSTKFILKQGNAEIILENGNAKIKGGTVQIDGATNLTTPTGAGPFCGLPNCLFTGAIHQTNKVE